MFKFLTSWLPASVAELSIGIAFVFSEELSFFLEPVQKTISDRHGRTENVDC